MKSSDSAALPSGSVFHSILAVYMPCSVIIPITLTAAVFFPKYVPSAVVFLSAFITAVGVSMLYAALDSKTEHAAAHMRAGILFAAAAWLCASLLRTNVSFPLSLSPGPANVLAALASLYIWTQTISLKNVFRMREKLQSCMGDKTGDELQRVMRDEMTLTADTDKHMKSIARGYTVQCCFAFLLPLFCALGRIRLPLHVTLSFIFLAAGAVFIYALLALYRKEQESAGEGVRIALSDSAKRITVMLFIPAAAAPLAFFFSSNISLFPLALIERFLIWITGFFKMSAGLPALNRPEKPDSYTGSFSIQPPAPAAAQEGAFDSAELLKWLKYGIFVLLAAGFLWFLVKPLFSRRSGNKKKENIYALWFKKLKYAFLSFFKALKSGKSSEKTVKKTGNSIRENTLINELSKRSVHKKKEIRKGVSLFAKIIIWGTENCLVPWKPQLAPAEYCLRLAEKRQELSSAIIRCGSLFEELLYASGSFSSEKQSEYEKLTDSIISSSE